jgi:hypothetical protein
MKTRVIQAKPGLYLQNGPELKLVCTKMQVKSYLVDIIERNKQLFHENTDNSGKTRTVPAKWARAHACVYKNASKVLLS